MTHEELFALAVTISAPSVARFATDKIKDGAAPEIPIYGLVLDAYEQLKQADKLLAKEHMEGLLGKD